MNAHSKLVIDFFEAIAARDLAAMQTALKTHPELATLEMTGQGSTLRAAFWSAAPDDLSDPQAFLATLTQEADMDRLLLEAGAPVDAADHSDPQAPDDEHHGPWSLLAQVVHEVFNRMAETEDGLEARAEPLLLDRLDAWLHALPADPAAREVGLQQAWAAWDKSLTARHFASRAKPLEPAIESMGRAVMGRLFQAGNRQFSSQIPLSEDRERTHHGWVREIQFHQHREDELHQMANASAKRPRQSA